MRWIATDRMLRARRSDSSLVSSSTCRTILAMSWRQRSSTWASSVSLACVAVMPEMRSSSASSMSLAAFSSSCICLACVSRSAIDCSRRATSSPRPLTISSRALTRSSILAISARRSPSSRSCSARCWSSSSRAVTRASFSCASARPSASARMRVAWRSASAVRPAPIRARTANPAPTPTISAARPISTSSIVTPSVCSPAGGRGRCHQERGALFRPQQIRAAPRGRPSDVPPVMAN